MGDNIRTVKTYIRYEKTVYATYFIALILCNILAVYLNHIELIESNTSVDLVFKFVTAIFFAVTIPLAYIIFRKNVEKAKRESVLANMLERYKVAYSFKLNMLTGVGLLVVIAYFITNNVYYLTLSAIILVIFSTNWFSVKKVIADLKLSSNQQQDLYNMETVLSTTIEKNFIQKNPWFLIIAIIFFLCLIFSEIKNLINL